MDNKEAIEWLKAIEEKYIHGGDERFDELRKEALDRAIKALEIVDDVNNKVYRNENCDRAGKCIDYIGWHCAGCGGSKE